MKDRIFRSKYLGGTVLALVFVIALFLRAILPHDQVFMGDWIRFTSVDSYFHMRLVDSLVANFPRLMEVDPYFAYAGRQLLGGVYFFHWLLAGIILVIGFGAPAPSTVDVVAVYFPAVLGALTVLPVYFIGKALFHRGVGLVAAALVAVLPGEFLGRSILGFTDYHVAEVLFTTTALLFLILAIKTARDRQLSLEQLRSWPVISRPLIYSLLAGLFLGVYFITWAGALLFVFIVTLFFVIQSVIDHLKGKSTFYLGLVGVAVMFPLLLIVASSSLGSFYLVPVVIALMVPPGLAVLSWLMGRWQLKPLFFPLAILGLGIAGMGVFNAFSPKLLGVLLAQLRIFAPTAGTELTTLEMKPFFRPVVEGGDFFLTPAWLNFRTTLILGLSALGILLGVSFQRRQFRPEVVFFLFWSLVIFLITVSQRRFAYYLTINIALLTAYITVLGYLGIILVVDYLRRRDTAGGWRQVMEIAGAVVPPGSSTGQAGLAVRDKRKPGPRPGVNYFGHVLAALFVFFLVFFPNIGPAVEVARAAPFAPSDGWHGALGWLEENTPEPFGDPGAYYQNFPPLLVGENFTYPESAYSVMAWWDYGYWISRVAHRIPYANPSQNPFAIKNTARFLLSQSEGEAREIIEASDSAYVVIDYGIATAKFWAIPEWGGREQSEYYELYYVPLGNQLRPFPFYYPEFYRSLLARLYYFDGKAVTPEKTMVISYRDEMTTAGETIRLVTDIKPFAEYQEAVDFVSRQERGNSRIVGENPLVSPVPLAALEDYRLVYSSREAVEHRGIVINFDEAATRVEIAPELMLVPEVKVFAYLPGSQN